MSSMPSADQIKTVGAGVATVLTGLIVIWWLIVVASVLDVAPEVNAQGAVVLDQFQRAKDILLVVFPLFSASVAYWVGSSGTAEAKKDVAAAQGQMNAVLDKAPQGTLEQAKAAHPDVF